MLQSHGYAAISYPIFSISTASATKYTYPQVVAIAEAYPAQSMAGRLSHCRLGVVKNGG